MKKAIIFIAIGLIIIYALILIYFPELNILFWGILGVVALLIGLEMLMMELVK